MLGARWSVFFSGEPIVFSSPKQSTAIQRKALGRVGAIGDLYDVVKDQFVEHKIFKKTIPSTLIEEIDVNRVNAKTIYTDKLSAKFESIGVEANLQLTLAFEGVLTAGIGGSAEFLLDKKSSSKSAKAYFVQTINTRYQSINMNDEGVDDYIDWSKFDTYEGTHVVVGIDWGGHCVLSVEDENKDDRKLMEISGELNGNINILEN